MLINAKNEQFTAGPASQSNQGLLLNLGNFSRISRGDYVEVNMPDSLRSMLATTPMESLDAMAQDNEYMFKARFGFVAPGSARREILAIKRNMDLTDEEVRVLWLGGHLNVTRKGASVKPQRLSFAVGWFYALVFSSFSSGGAIVILTSNAHVGEKVLGLIIVLSIWAASLWYTSKFHLFAWRLLGKLGVKRWSFKSECHDRHLSEPDKRS